MAEYKRGFPSQEVRLRNWPAGRAAAMRLMVNRLETTLNDTLAAQVEQSAARRLNENIPFILDLTITAGFKQSKVDFTVPPGLGGTSRGASKHPDRQLLFYEIQPASSSSFSNPVILQTPQISTLVSGVAVGQVRFFRARVVNTKNEASPWSTVVRSRAARGSISVNTMNVGDKSVRLTGSIGQWQTIFSEEYDAPESAFCAMTHLAVGAIQEDVGFYLSGPAHVQFRWLIDLNNTTEFREIEGGGRCLLSAVPGSTAVHRGKAPMAFGSFMTPFINAPGTDIVGIKLQAAKRPGSEWAPSGLADTSLNLLVNSGDYVNAANIQHWWRLGFDPEDLGGDYGIASTLIDMDQSAVGVTSADIFKEPPTNGPYVDLDGSTEYFSNIINQVYGVASTFSISAWVRLDGGLGVNAGILDINDGTTQNSRILLFKNTSDLWTFRAANAGNTVANDVSHPTAVTSANFGQWVHIAAVRMA